MCKGFGMIITADMQGYFCEPDTEGDCSHSEILNRLGWKDNKSEFVRRFVRVQCPNWTMDSFEFDEESTLPGWAEEGTDQIRAITQKTLDVCDAAWAEYEKVRDAARAEYEKVRDAAWAEYEKVRDAAWAAMIAITKSVPGYVAA